MKSLYEITTSLEQVNEALIDSGGDVTPELESQLAILQEELQVKGANYGLVILNNEASVKAIDEAMDRLKTNKARIENANEKLKHVVSEAMQHFGIEKIETPIVKLSFRASESIEITNEAVLPKDCVTTKTTTSPDKKKIKELIKSGTPVDGAHLKQSKNLQIK